MKLTVFILTVFCLHVSAGSFSQTVTLSANNQPLQQVLKSIQRQTNYTFFAKTSLLKTGNGVTVNLTNATIGEALQAVFKDQPLTYSIDGNIIVIEPLEKVTPPGAISPPVVSPPDTLRGHIVDEKGRGVVASVIVKGTGNGTTTNDAGYFILKGVDPAATLVITGVGIETFEVKVNGRTELGTLSAKIKVTEEDAVNITVNTGYQQLPKERATGSFAFVDNKLFNRKTGPDVLSRLEGIVPGLLVNRNVNTGINPNGIDISIRGYSTLFSNGQPLIVVDNFPYDGNINNINPNDIENVTVLKDAAAASIWGAQSGNGVIVITTKKGKRNQKLSIEVNANITAADKPDLYYNPNFLNSVDFIGAEQYAFDKGYYDARFNDPNEKPVSPVLQILYDERVGNISSTEATTKINALKNVDIRDDLSRYFYDRAVLQQYNINLKGGGQNNDYLFSIGYDKNKDAVAGNANDRITLYSLNHFYPVKNLVLTAGINYIRTQATNNSPVNDLVTGNDYLTSIFSYEKLVGGNGEALAIVKDYNYVWITDPAAQAGLLDWQYRPLDELHNTDNTSRLSDIRLNFGAKYSFLRDFEAELNYQYENSQNNSRNYYSPETYYARNLINRYTNLNGSPRYPIPVGGILQQSRLDMDAYHLRGQLNYNKTIHAWHTISALAGAEMNQSVVRSNGELPVYGYNADNGTSQNVDFVNYFLLNPLQSSSKIPGNKSLNVGTDRYISYFSNASYSYKNRYIISASARIDKSNLFGVKTNQKSVPLYSIGASWELSKERFYHFDLLPYSKLRATYGYNGNLNKSATAVATFYQFGSSYYTGIPFATISNPGNAQLRWERDRMINFAYEFASRNHIISGSIEYFIKRGFDLFGNSPLAPSTGQSTFYGNTASIKGQGYDIVLNGKIISRPVFSWKTILLFSHALDKITSYEAPSTINSYLHLDANAYSITPKVGRPIFSIYSYASGPLTHDTGDPQGYVDGKLSTDYTQILATNSEIDSLVFNGSARPTTYGSLMNTFTYNHFSLSVNIIYKLGYYFRRSSISYQALFAGGDGHKDFASRWKQPGDETKTIVPSMPDPTTMDYNRNFFYSYSDALVDRGDHIRLQDITLSYYLENASWLKNAFKRIDFYFNINNIGILWRANKDGLDPDVFANGYPSPKTYSLGIKTNF